MNEGQLPGNWDFTTEKQIGNVSASFDEFFRDTRNWFSLSLSMSKYHDTTCKMNIIVINKVEKLVYGDFTKDLINFIKVISFWGFHEKVSN